MRLYDIPGNPPPPGGRCGAFDAEDGVTLRYALWPAHGEARGTVCLFHDRGECIELHYETIGDLVARGFAVATFDWRGQGGSERLLPDGRRGYVEDFAHYERDLQAFRRKVALPDCPPPFFGLALGMAGPILLQAAPRLTPWIDRLVLAAPLLDLPPSAFSRVTVARFTALACAFGLGDRYLPFAEDPARGPFEGNDLTGDPVRHARYAAIARVAPEIASGRATIAWMRAALRAMARLDAADAVERSGMPVLLVAAGADRMVSTRAIERMARRLRTRGHVLVPGARHALFLERDLPREQVWAAFDAFVPGAAARPGSAREPAQNDLVEGWVA